MEQVVRGLEYGASALVAAAVIVLLVIQISAYRELIPVLADTIQNNPIVMEQKNG